MEFDNNLKELRIKSGLTQEQLAEKLNVNLRTYQGWEIGKSRPNYETLEKIINFFGCSYDDLLK